MRPTGDGHTIRTPNRSLCQSNASINIREAQNSLANFRGRFFSRPQIHLRANQNERRPGAIVLNLRKPFRLHIIEALTARDREAHQEDVVRRIRQGSQTIEHLLTCEYSDAWSTSGCSKDDGSIAGRAPTGFQCSPAESNSARETSRPSKSYGGARTSAHMTHQVFALVHATGLVSKRVLESSDFEL